MMKKILILLGLLFVGFTASAKDIFEYSRDNIIISDNNRKFTTYSKGWVDSYVQSWAAVLESDTNDIVTETYVELWSFEEFKQSTFSIVKKDVDKKAWQKAFSLAKKNGNVTLIHKSGKDKISYWCVFFKDDSNVWVALVKTITN